MVINGGRVFWFDGKLCLFVAEFQQGVSKFEKYREVEIVKKCFKYKFMGIYISMNI